MSLCICASPTAAVSPAQHELNENHHGLSIPAKLNSTDLSLSSWTSSIARYCRVGRLDHAATEFTRMRLAGVQPNHVTFVTLLSACAGAPSFGASVHALVCKHGFGTGNVKVGTAMVGMYCKCSRVDLACLCFEKMGTKNNVTWNTLVAGLMRNGEVDSALHLFDEMPERDVVSYTALIDGFVKRGRHEQALEWFRRMQTSGVEPDHVTIVSALSACAHLGALGLGLWLHAAAIARNMTGHVRVNNALVDMYSRCGCVDLALQVFDTMPVRNLVSWNSIVVGLALNGHATESLDHFHRMREHGFEPDGVTFTGALTACTHAGLVDQASTLFDTMKTYKIRPSIEHYGCLVDLYGRARMLKAALNVVNSMPMAPNEVVLGSVLAACRAVCDVALAETLVRFVSGDAGYVVLSNMYAVEGEWRKASGVRRRMKTRGITKETGASSIEIDGVVEKFVAGDKSHVESERVYATLETLRRELSASGYVPEMDE